MTAETLAVPAEPSPEPPGQSPTPTAPDASPSVSADASPASAAAPAEPASPRSLPLASSSTAAVQRSNPPLERTSSSAPNCYLLIAVCAALSAGLGAVGGSAGIAGLEHLLSSPSTAPRADPVEELRPLKDAVVQLRSHVKSVGDNVAALRSSFSSSASAANAQLTKLAEQVEKVERAQAEHRPAPEITGTVPTDAKTIAPPKPAIIDGWVLRRVFNGEVALLESRHGMIEIEAGDSLPGVGRVQEIKRQDGRWVVVTAKGMILPGH